MTKRFLLTGSHLCTHTLIWATVAHLISSHQGDKRIYQSHFYSLLFPFSSSLAIPYNVNKEYTFRFQFSYPRIRMQPHTTAAWMPIEARHTPAPAFPWTNLLGWEAHRTSVTIQIFHLTHSCRALRKYILSTYHPMWWKNRNLDYSWRKPKEIHYMGG